MQRPKSVTIYQKWLQKTKCSTHFWIIYQKSGGEEDWNPRPATKDEHVLPPHHGCVCDFFWHVSLYMFGPIIWNSKPKKYELGCMLAPGPSRPAGASCKLEPICQGNWREKRAKIDAGQGNWTQDLGLKPSAPYHHTTSLFVTYFVIHRS